MSPSKINSEQPETTTYRKWCAEIGLRQIPEEQNRGVMGGTGFEPDSLSDGDVTGLGKTGETEPLSDAAGDAISADLGIVLESWPRLSDVAKRKILKLVCADTDKTDKSPDRRD